MSLTSKLGLLLAISVVAIGAAPGERAALLTDQSDGRDWPAYGRTYGEQHYSPLAQIDAGNVGRLGLAWSLDLPAGNTVTQPLEVDGILYFTVGYSVIHAVDALSGKELWTYDPKATLVAGKRMRYSWGSRGIAYWNGKIYTGTVDGRLIAVDAHTGAEVWSRQTLGSDEGRFITGAPRILNGKVIIGHGGADTARIRGYVTTYDAETGRQLWRFYVVPGDPAKGFEDEAQAMAAKTWSGEWWKFGGGGAAWNAFTYDPDTDTVFVGTGNGSPWNHHIRSQGKGDNLFLCSIVALDATTGKYKWHYQVNPGESWDYNAAMDMHLPDRMIGGRMRKLLVTAPKNGFLYVLDRTTGEFISAEKIAKVTWATGIDPKTGRAHEVPDARYPDGKTFAMWPSSSGAHSALPSAFSPQTGLVYIPLINSGMTVKDDGAEFASLEGKAPFNPGLTMGLGSPAGLPAATSALLAWNPVTQKMAWKVPTPMMWNGGLLTTGGNLVYQGQVDGSFNAYDARTGKKLWSFAAQGAVMAPAISYSIKGRQYVTVLTGMGISAGVDASLLPARFDYRTQNRRVLTFALGGKATIPAAIPYKPEPIADTGYRADPAAAGRGAFVFGRRCLGCHGVSANAGGGLAPDLRTSAIPQSAAAFDTIVRRGALLPRGMPVFAELADNDINDLRQYLRSRAADLREGRDR